MTQVASRGAARRKRHDRIRLTMAGTAGRPRLAVFRSLNHIYAQVIDDASGRTLVAASTVEKELRGSKATKSEEAASIGKLVAERATHAAAIGRLKGDGPVYRPEREAEVLRRVAAANPGPLPAESLTRVFVEIVSGCRALEQRPVLP